MATYLDLYSLRQDDDLTRKVSSAVAIAADKIRTEDPATINHANRIVWAKTAFSQPEQVAVAMMWALLAANKTMTMNQLKSASDSAIQAAVEAAIDIFADGVI